MTVKRHDVHVPPKIEKCCQHQLVLGRLAVGNKTNEITAIPELLTMLDIDYKEIAEYKTHFRDIHMSNILILQNTGDLY